MTVRELLHELFGTIAGLPAIERHARNLEPRWREISGKYPDLPELTEIEERGWIRRHENRAVLTYEKGRLSRLELDSVAVLPPATKGKKLKSSGAELLLQL